ncbi:hypothetical protein SKAU_G00347830 [Synaphobranchus kaupii]|uniref:Uncharacterized protein n=1 Tax=Synaphobranchus kaupii TaxID=118154 RepID=A0A9Q1EK32_SYNKA|nr:hypothetical protein SKAU_G00347830 [Synaphobranchus kaupii]
MEADHDKTTRRNTQPRTRETASEPNDDGGVHLDRAAIFGFDRGINALGAGESVGTPSQNTQHPGPPAAARHSTTRTATVMTAARDTGDSIPPQTYLAGGTPRRGSASRSRAGRARGSPRRRGYGSGGTSEGQSEGKAPHRLVFARECRRFPGSGLPSLIWDE